MKNFASSWWWLRCIVAAHTSFQQLRNAANDALSEFIVVDKIKTNTYVFLHFFFFLQFIILIIIATEMHVVASVVNRMHNAHIQNDKFSINYTPESGAHFSAFTRRRWRPREKTTPYMNIHKRCGTRYGNVCICILMWIGEPGARHDW